MSYDFTDYDGYVIDVKVLLGDFPEELVNVTGEDFDPDAMMSIISSFVEEHIHKDLSVEVTGSWWGDFSGHNPFLDGEAFACFSKDELMDEVRKDGQRCLSESALFAQLKAFMKTHNIPEESLRYEEWTCGG